MEKSPVTAATGALGPVMDKLAALLGGEYKLRRRTRSDIKLIKSKLKSMHSLLWTICERGLLDAASKELKMEALDLADDVDDAIDDFIVSMERSPSNKRFIQTKVKANHFEDFKRRVNDVSRRCRGMWKKKKTAQPISMPRAHPFVRKDASELVGLDEPRDQIIQHLLGEEETTLVEPKLKMASICGMVGMGKTTLARLVYEEIENRFQARVFVSLTTPPNMKVILTSILEQVADDCSVTLSGTKAATEEHLVRIISKFLEDKRYLVIIDNIWQCGEWEIVSKCFPENNLGSRIVTTTRLNSIAEKWRADYDAFVHKMDPEWNFYSKRWSYEIRNEDVGNQMIDMKSAMVGERFESDHPIVDIFAGMPLAVDCMLSACAKEREHQEQQGACVTTREVQDRVEKQVKRNGIQNTPGFEPLVERLQLYYDDLPHLMLKTFLLYCGVYPLHDVFNVNILVNGWITEGFVYEQKAAKGYFEDLVNLGFLQEISFIFGYRMHPVMQNFLRCKSREDNFTTSSCEIPSSYTCRIRRLFIENMPCGDAQEQVYYRLFGLDWSHIRSLSVGVDDVTIVPFKKMECLRVLRIHGTSYIHNQQLKDVCGLLRLRHLFILEVEGICEIPSEIWRLQQLKTLDVSHTKITELPKEIGKLQNLNILDVSHTNITEVPREIGKLQQLKTLDVEDTEITELPKEIGKLQQLKTLDVRHTEITELPKEIGKLQQLKTLDVNYTNITDLPGEIVKLQQLKTLDVSHTEITELPKEIGKLQNLNILDVNYTNITKLPAEIGKLQQLKTLDVSYTNITELPKEIVNLQQLKTLDVSHTEITELPKEIGKLQQLKTLDVSHTKITKLPKELGKLQQLKTLDVAHTKITKLPKELGNLQHLETLRLKRTCVMNIPREIGGLKKLKNLDADYDQDVVRLSLEFCQVSKWVKLPDCIHRALKKGDLVSSLAGEILSIDQEEGALVVGAKHMHIPQWLKEHFNDLAALDIRICKLDEEDLKILREMPNLSELFLRFEVVPREPISISGEGFTRLVALLIDSRFPRVTFQEEAMPMLETLVFEFQFYTGPPNKDHMGICHLKSLDWVSFVCTDWYRADRPCISATIDMVRKEAQEHPNRIIIEVTGRGEIFPENKSAQISEETNEASSSGTGEI